MNRWRQLADNRLLDVGAAVLALLCLVKLALVLPARADREDFSHYYMWSRSLLEHRNPYTTALPPFYVPHGFALGEEPLRTANYPPPFVWLFVPLAALERHVAFVLWVGAQGLCLGVMLGWTRRLLGPRLSPRGFYFICLGVLMSAPFYWHLYFSQTQLMLGALLLTAYGLRRGGHPTAACLVVAVAGVLKLYPLAFLPWFVWRGGTTPRARTWLAVQAALAVAALVLITDLRLWVDFFQSWWPTSKIILTHRTFNFSLPAFILIMLNATAPVLSLPSGWQLTVSMWSGMALLALSYLRCWQARADAETEFCLLVVATLVAHAVAEGHYLVLLIFPVAVAATRLAAAPTLRGLLLFLLLVLSLNDVLPATARLDGHPYLSAIINHMPLYGMLGLLVFFARTQNRDEPAARRNSSHPSL